MKKSLLLFFLLAYSFSFSQHLVNNDTVWTRDLWKTGTINQVQFLPDGRSVAVATGAGVSVFDVNTSDLIKRFDYPVPGNNNPCNSFCFTEDGSRLITAHDNASIVVWDWEKVDTISVFDDIAMWHIKIYDTQTIIGIGNLPIWTYDSTRIYLLDINLGKINQKINTNPGKKITITAFDVLKSKNQFALITTDGRKAYVEQWDLISLQKVSTLGTHEVRVTDLAFGSDGKYLASASCDGIIKIWDVVEKKLVKALTHVVMGDGYLHVQFSPETGYLVSSGGIGYMNTKIWDLRTDSLIFQYPFPFGAQYAFDLSNDSNYISIGSGPILTLLNAHWLPVGVDELQDKTVRVLYPNPAGNQITIPVEYDIAPITVSISNSTGQIVKIINQSEPISRDLIIDISGLLPGIYFVSVSYPAKTVSFKFEKGL